MKSASVAYSVLRELPVVLALAMLACSSAPAPAPSPEPASSPHRLIASSPALTIDDFESPSTWTAHPATGVSLRIARDTGRNGGQAMRLDYDFHGGGGYAIARRVVQLAMPANYELTFWIRGEAQPQNLEFKLVDPSGDNVWWVNRRDFAFPRDWRKVTIRKRHISFAWGPLGGGDLTNVAAIELAITAGSGGTGTVWLDDLTLTPLDPPPATLPAPVASASSSGAAAAGALDGDPGTAWRSAEGDAAPTLTVDFRATRELGGFTIDWDSLDYATHYVVETSAEGSRWDSAYAVSGGNGGRDYLYMPETEARAARLIARRTSRGRGVGVRELTLRPLSWSASLTDFVTAAAKDAPRGSYPRYFDSVMTYWTIVGVNGDRDEALFNTDGMLETGKASFSLEPFLHVDGDLLTWADVQATPSLLRGSLPIPSVDLSARDLGLTVTAYADSGVGMPTLVARYRLENRGARRRDGTLFIAIRPFQVNPTWQFLNTPGGVAPVRELGRSVHGPAVRVNGSAVVVPSTSPAGFGAATFDQGGIMPHLRAGRVPPADSASDPLGLAEGALAYSFALAPGAVQVVEIALPVNAPLEVRSVGLAAVLEQDGRIRNADLEATAARWEKALGPVQITLPETAARIPETIRASLAYILINRDGPWIQPGSRSYERSWIRDGSLTSAAMLRLGHAAEVREFIQAYARAQYANGKVPCCVDRRGADPVPEHDSHGQLIYLIAEYWRHTGDRALLDSTWTNVRMAVAYIDSLRQSRMTAPYRSGDSTAYFGLVPQSISHEGYSAKPMHSFWDDLFTLRGLKDAAVIAAALGQRDTAAVYRAMTAEFRRAVVNAYEATMRNHGIDYLAGAVELGDFDPTSTTIAMNPVEEEASLPRTALLRTFERYWEESQARARGTRPWEGYTPYELRSVGAFVRLGQRDRANAMLDFFFRHQRPAAWRQWAEVVWNDPATPKFIGDMPHTWVASDFIRSALDMLAYEREADSSLVIAAGVPLDWVRVAPGVTVRNLSTHYGTLAYTMREEQGALRIRIARGVRVPRGGIVVRPPIGGTVRRVTVNGRAARLVNGEIVVRAVPADIVVRF